MGHGHHHHHESERGGDGRLVAAIAVNGVLTAVQVAGGLLAGSLSLVADALHNLNDAASLAVALVARKLSRRPADRARTFGYRRAEVIGALINLTALVLVGVYLIYESVARYFDPRAVDGWIMVVVAGIALAVDAGTAALTYAQSTGSMNIRAAFVHNLADALGSLAVMIVGTLVLLFGWHFADVIAALLLAGFILYQGLSMMKGSIHILMDSVPPDIELQALTDRMASVPEVLEVHHLHVRQLDEHAHSLEAHVVVDPSQASRIEPIKEAVKTLLHAEFGITHSTLEFELEGARHDEDTHDRGVVAAH